MPEPSDSSNDSDDNRKKNTSDGTLANINFSGLYKGSSSYFPGQPFDDGLSKFEGAEKEKMALAKKIEKRKKWDKARFV